MMKSKITSIVKYTVEKNIRNKWFIILNILMFGLILITFNFGTVKEILSSHQVKVTSHAHIIVQGEEKQAFENIQKALQEYVSPDEYELEYQPQIQNYQKGDIDKNTVVVQVTASPKDMIEAKVISEEGIKTEYTKPIMQGLNQTKKALFAKSHPITEEQIDMLQQNVSIDRVTLGVDSKDATNKQGIQTVFNYLILIALLMVLSKIANDISQEKVSKSIEYVLTNISAKGYLIAKVLSVNITLVVQLMFTGMYFLIGMFTNSALRLYFLPDSVANLSSTMDTTMVANMIDGKFLLYVACVLGYLIVTVLIISVIQAVMSSKTTNIDEAGNATILLVTINLILYVLSTLLITPLKVPSVFVYILSCIPGISMYFIPTMVLLGQATGLQIVIATVLMIIAVPVIFHYGAKWFKNGVLDYTKKEEKKQKTTLSPLEREEQKIIKKEYSKIGFVIGFSILLFLILQLLISYVGTLVAPTLATVLQGVFTVSEVTSMINIISFILSLVIPACFVMLYTPKEKKRQPLDKKACFKYVFMALPLVYLLQIVIGYVLEKLGLNYDIMSKTNMFDNSSVLSMALFFIQVAILPAIFEELFVRHALLKYLKQYGVGFSIMTTAIIFSFIHLNISQMIFAFLMGVILATIAIKTNSIWPTAIIHFLNNGYAALTMIWQNHSSWLLILNVVYFVMIVIGAFVLLVTLFKESNNLFGIKKEPKEREEETTKNKISYKKYRYLGLDYSFVLAAVSMVVLLFVMQKMISIL